MSITHSTDLFGHVEPMARSRDPVTSHMAADQAKKVAADHQLLILNVLTWFGPLGKDGIASRTHITGVQACRRLSELERAGKIAPTGKLVPSTAGRSEREWKVL